MHTSKRMTIAYLAMAAALLALFALNLFWGSIALSRRTSRRPCWAAAQTRWRPTSCCSCACRAPSWSCCWGGALGGRVSAANVFANPIAGPFVMGISSGAKLAVALTMVVFF